MAAGATVAENASSITGRLVTVSRLADAVERAGETMRDAASAETPAFGPVDQSQVLRIVGLDPRDPKAHAVVAVARRYALDPVLGHISILRNSTLPYVTRDGFLHIAHRSGQLDGIEVVDGPRREGSEWVARVAVFRRDMAHAFIYPGRADVADHNGPEMAITRAERRALKRAFAVTLPSDFADDENTPANAPSATERHDPPPARVETPTEQERQALALLNEGAPAVVDAPLPGDEPPPGELSPQQRRAIFAQCSRLGLASADDETRSKRLALFGRILGRDVQSTVELSEDEASELIHTLASMAADEERGNEE